MFVSSPVYNLFRRRLAPDLFCAVPENRPVPTFIQARNWRFVGKCGTPAQAGFDPEAARTAVRFNGFYLFVAFNLCERERTPSRAIPRIIQALRTAMRVRSAQAPWKVHLP